MIGPNADRAVIMGGGSASLPVAYRRTPVEALRDRFGPDVEVVHEPGVDIAVTTPEIPVRVAVGRWATRPGHRLLRP